jgi:hypothetical protein
MYSDEVQEKLNAEKAAAVNAANLIETCGSVNPAYWNGMLQTQATGIKQEPLAYRIERQLRNASSDRDRYARALDILNRHPEFEELIELLNMHLI